MAMAQPPAGFYGKAGGAAAADALVSALLRRVAAATRTAELETMAAEYREFPRLDLARAYAAMRRWKLANAGRPGAPRPDDAADIRLFARQRPDDGTRRFAAATRRGACERAMTEAAERRHFYEMLESDENDGHTRSQCHAFLDVEFARTEADAAPGEPCADAVGDALVDEAVARLQRQAAEQLGCRFARVYELDSSTSAKFSRHLILQLPAPRMFRSARHVGPFVGAALGRAAPLVAPAASADAGRSVVDMGVYTRNRMFRTCFSRKHGKNKAQLDLTPRFDGKELLEAAEAARKAPAIEHPLGAPVSNAPLDAGDCLVWLSLLAARPAVHEAGASPRADPDAVAPTLDGAGGAAGACAGGGTAGAAAPAASGHAASSMPFPEVEAFLLEVCRCKAPDSQPRIRSWALFADADDRRDVLVVNINGHRFCENVNREHKSNGVYYIIDYRLDAFYQRCYDPDCSGFRGAVMPLPKGLQRGGCPAHAAAPPPSGDGACYWVESACPPAPSRAPALAPRPRKRYRLVAPTRFDASAPALLAADVP